MFTKTKHAALVTPTGGVKAIVSGRVPDGWTEISAREFKRMKSEGLTLDLGRNPSQPTLRVGLFRFIYVDGKIEEYEGADVASDLYRCAPALHELVQRFVDAYKADVPVQKVLVERAERVLAETKEGQEDLVKAQAVR